MPRVPNSCLQTWCVCFWLTFWLWDPPQRLSVVHYIILETCWMTACVGKVVLSAISSKFCCFQCLCLPSATFIGFGFSSPPPFLFYGACWLLSHGWDQKAWEAGGTDRASLVGRISGKAFGQESDFCYGRLSDCCLFLLPAQTHRVWYKVCKGSEMWSSGSLTQLIFANHSPATHQDFHECQSWLRVPEIVVPSRRICLCRNVSPCISGWWFPMYISQCKLFQ